MKFNLAVVGDLPEDEKLYRQINELADYIEKAVFPDDKPEINALISPQYSGGNWKAVMMSRNYSLYGYFLSCDEPPAEDFVHNVIIDSSVRSVIGETICDKTDLMLCVWNENLLEMNGATWELIQTAQHTKVPCIWISTKNYNKIYWSYESWFEPYRASKIDEFGKALRSGGIEPEGAGQKKWPLLAVGARLQNRFLARHKSRADEIPAEKDELLRDDFRDSGIGSEKIRKSLLEKFNLFDRAAIDNASMYHTVMYWRAILPFAASVFLGLGFYADPIFSHIINATVLEIIVGISFLIHGLINLYVFWLSKSPYVKKWHRQFLSNRYIAEILRVLIHFTPYGISLNLRNLCGSDKRVYAAIREIVRENENDSIKLNRNNAHVILDHLIGMVEDQINYHHASAERYNSIVNSLKKWYGIIFKAGFIFVLLRAVLQFAIVILGKTNFPLFSDGSGILAGSNIKEIKSYANMFAMMVPAWASFFSSKLSQCSYEYNYENHLQMEAELRIELERLQNAKKLDSAVLLEALEAIAERLSEIMLIGDTSLWHSKMKKAKVTQL